MTENLPNQNTGEDKDKVITWLDNLAKKDEERKASQSSEKDPGIVVDFIPTDLQNLGIDDDSMPIPSMLQIPEEAYSQVPSNIQIMTRDPESTLEEICKNKGYVTIRGFKKEDSSKMDLELTQKLGAGGFGVVYKAKGKGVFTKNLALKVVKPQKTPQEEYIAQKLFQKEITALADFDDNSFAYLNFAGILDQTGTRAYTSEFIEGSTISAIIKRSRELLIPIHPMVAAMTLWRCLGGASSMKAEHLAHRDFKEENVMISSKRGATKILDLGSIKSGLDNDGFARFEAAVGTPTHQHPDVYSAASGMSINYSAADTYALCTMAYHMLTGILPYPSDIIEKYDENGNWIPLGKRKEKKEFDALAYYLIKDKLMRTTELVPPNKINPLVPKFLSDLVMSGLNPDLNEIPSASKLKDSLQPNYLHCSFWGGVGVQDASLKDYFAIMNNIERTDMKESVKGKVSLKPLALANHYEDAVKLYNIQKQTMRIQRGKDVEVEKRGIETDPRIAHKIDYSQKAIFPSVRKAMGKAMTYTLAQFYDVPIENESEEELNVCYETMLEYDFIPKAKKKLGNSATERQVKEEAERIMVNQFYKLYKQHRKTAQNGAALK